MDKRRKISAANGPVRIGRIAEALLDPVVSQAGFSSTQILSAWPDIVGPELAGRSRPEKLRWPPRRKEDGAGGGATLVVRAEGGDALEVQYAASEIVARLNAMFGWRAVARLAIRQAPVGEGPDRRQPPGEGRGGHAEPGGEMDDLGAVADEGLRAALARLGARIGRSGDTKP